MKRYKLLVSKTTIVETEVTIEAESYALAQVITRQVLTPGTRWQIRKERSTSEILQGTQLEYDPLLITELGD